VLAGIRALVLPETRVNYARGCELIGYNRDGFAEAVAAAQQSDVAVVVLGLSQLLEGEQQAEEGLTPGTRSMGDRGNIDLPIIQEQLLEAVHATGTPVVLVLINGSALAVNWADEHVPAILEAWYPGQAGGTAIAEAIFGVTNPGGRLPVTFYHSISDLPHIDDYDMQNRTYRYFKGEPLYAFGHGLSYTTFTYSALQIAPAEVKPGATVTVQVDVENSGSRLGDEVVQLYVQDVEAAWPVPQLQLQGFTRLRLAPGARQTVCFSLTAEQLSVVDDAGTWHLEPGDFKVWVGGQQPNLQSSQQPANVREGQFTIRA
jgi:beta-glucosidase